MQIMEICYESGYNDVTNFNRRFKEIINLKPYEYRKNFSKMVKVEKKKKV